MYESETDERPKTSQSTREEMQEAMRQAARKKKGTTMVVSSGMTKKPTIARKLSSSELGSVGSPSRPGTAGGDHVTSPGNRKLLFDEDEIPDAPLPASEAKPNALEQKLREIGIDTVYEPEKGKRFEVAPGPAPTAAPTTTLPIPSQNPKLGALFFTDLEQFVTSPAPEGLKIQCSIFRDKHGGADKNSFPTYILKLERPVEGKPIEHVFLLAGRKRKIGAAANYAISMDENDFTKGESYLAKLKSNFVGTQFTIFDNGVNPHKAAEEREDQHERRELAAVIYEFNPLGFWGPRKMTVLLPGMDEHQRALTFAPTTESETLLGRHKAHMMANIVELINKTPLWNEETQSFVLNFYGRVSMASVKNFQIIHPNDPNYVILQFGRTGQDSFTMDYQYPMSAVQAFAIVLSSFDGKLAVE